MEVRGSPTVIRTRASLPRSGDTSATACAPPVLPGDAVSAARAAQSGRAAGAPRGQDGSVEAIRALMVAKRSAAGECTRTINQARALVLTGLDDLRARFARHTPAALVARLASLRSRPGDVAGYATQLATLTVRGAAGRGRPLAGLGVPIC